MSLLRFAIGGIYIWFGVLKFFPGLSSAEQLAGRTIELMTLGLLTPQISIPLLAGWETAVGLLLISGKLPRVALIMLYPHIAGTFAPLILLSEHTWSAPPFAASLEGQYIFKNLVTLASALVIGTVNSCERE